MRSYGGWKGSGEAWAPGITLTRANSYGVLLLYQELAQRFLSVTSEYLVLSIYWIDLSQHKGEYIKWQTNGTDKFLRERRKCVF